MKSLDQYSSQLPLQEIVEVVRGGKEGYTSKLITKRALKAGQVISKLEGLTLAKKRYTTVQVGISEHMELNSDLVYMNHSCEPSAIVDTVNLVVTATRDLAAGDEITFFYPTTEWEMDQPFECWCGNEQCIKKVQGAKSLPTSTLKKYFINRHISQLLTSDQYSENN